MLLVKWCLVVPLQAQSLVPSLLPVMVRFPLLPSGVVTSYPFCLHTVFIADTGKAVFVWVGSGASEGERKYGMICAQVSSAPHPLATVVVTPSLSLLPFPLIELLEEDWASSGPRYSTD